MRRIFAGASLISSLVFIAAAALWIASPHVISAPNAPFLSISEEPARDVALANGRLVFHQLLPDGDEQEYGWKGLAFGAHEDHGGRVFFVLIDLWIIMLVAAVCPAYWALSAVRRKRWQEGRCFVCGYDLRATPNRCPECGHAGNTPPSDRATITSR
jgi:hypothetical protein